LGDDAPKTGDWAQYLNPMQTPDDIAALVGTNGYEILTGLGKRAERIYIESGIHHNQSDARSYMQANYGQANFDKTIVGAA
jgi:hypothetical protein